MSSEVKERKLKGNVESILDLSGEVNPGLNALQTTNLQKQCCTIKLAVPSTVKFAALEINERD